MTDPKQDSDVVELEFPRLGLRGDAVGTFEDKPLYAADVVPGERMLVRIRKRYRKMAVAEPLEIRDRSPHRTEPPCPLFHGCSGCQLQHIDYEHQLVLKRRVLQGQLADAGFGQIEVRPVLGAEQPWHYRNHARFTVEGGMLGFVRRRPREFFAVPHCHIMRPEINDLLSRLSGRLPDASQCNIRIGTRTGEHMIQPRLSVDDVPSGQPHLHEILLGRTFRISAPAFFQVNTPQAERMIELVRERLALQPREVVVDAYAGVGTFAAHLAGHAAKVVAIEESVPALEDAQVNLQDLPVELHRGKVEQVLPSLQGPVDAVILDPPRSGCHETALRTVLDRGPRRMVYVSCDAESLTRDLRVLCKDAYRVTEIQPIDMFPHTRHLETVTTLQRVTPADPTR